MKRSLVFIVLILEEFFQTEALSITGTVGTAIKITCSHSYATTNVKYFCKGACNDADVLIKSNVPEPEKNGKYLIQDEGNTFYVTINNLEKSDAGTYWCGIDRVGADTYNKVILTVKEAENPVGTLKTSHSEMILYVGAGLSVAVLALATVLLLFLRLRKRNVGTSHGKENDDIQYVTTVFQKNTQHANGTSSVSEDQGADARIYADLSEVRHPNSSAEPKTQLDYVYSTINFRDHPARGSVPPQRELTEYSSVKLKYAATTS